ncbi:dihydroxyacetone kinase family protein [Lentzea sp. JNUCC 0626]|uniref:dihydroxyacetone kinase family protein n=1 Tax=Lentzea sp. JNUCC 0626 TaxID=3367513 RepID=UPI00374A5AAF
MTRIFDDPARFAEDQLEGFLDLYADRLRGVPGGVVAHRTDRPQVAVVIGGGSGHYPAFCGTVGPGFATGAVVGNIFTSPSASQAASVGRAADQGRGVIFSFGNYAGDVINFGLAADRMRDEGIDTRILLVTDDIASSPEIAQRRGIAGDFTVFKVLGAAAAEGHDIDVVETFGRQANDHTRTLGVAFSGCTMPGADDPLFTVPPGQLGLGLGIHGEPGIRDMATLPATELGRMLVDDLLADAPDTTSRRVAVILNGLGTTKYEELFLLWRIVAARLREAGLTIVAPEVGELVTSLDMGGCSLTLMWLNDDLERLWCADAYTPGYRKTAAPLQPLLKPTASEHQLVPPVLAVPSASADSVALAATIRAVLKAARDTIAEHEHELGRIDAVAGDGDHGRGMRKGVEAALARAEGTGQDAGAGWVLRQAGQAWADEAGGTSGVLWGAALEAVGRDLDDYGAAFGPDDLARAVREFTATIHKLGKAKLGDKTMVDALVPFGTELETALNTGVATAKAWSVAAAVATLAAAETAELTPRIGRARPLAEKSVGTPDAGATSFALLCTAIGSHLTSERPA